MATFMEVLDTSIANVSLPHIAGNLSASQDESTWVLTSYLVANAVVLPISGWLATRIGRKRFYMTCVALFTVSSFLCGLAPILGTLVFFRVLQGVGGGGLAPASRPSWPTPSRRPSAAWHSPSTAWPWCWRPAIGPTLGGFITDHFSWRWIFFINVPVGMVSLFLTNRLVSDPPHIRVAAGPHRSPSTTWVSPSSPSGSDALEIVLDKGQEDDWFASRFITVFAVVAAVCSGVPSCSGS